MTTSIDPQKTALLLLDFQNIHIQRFSDATNLLTSASSAAATARGHGILVVHCRIAFTAEESQNLPPVFVCLKGNAGHLAAMHVDAPTSQFHPDVSPREGDVSIIKKRVAPFRNAPENFDAMMRDRGVDTLVIGGIATGGAVLSTVLEAVDLDYNVVLLKDCCADPSSETHEFLLKFLEKRVSAIDSSEFASNITS